MLRKLHQWVSNVSGWLLLHGRRKFVCEYNCDELASAHTYQPSRVGDQERYFIDSHVARMCNCIRHSIYCAFKSRPAPTARRPPSTATHPMQYIVDREARTLLAHCRVAISSTPFFSSLHLRPYLSVHSFVRFVYVNAAKQSRTNGR